MDLDRVLDGLLADRTPPPDAWTVRDLADAATARGTPTTYDSIKNRVRAALAAGTVEAVGRYPSAASPGKIAMHYRWIGTARL